jgi:hypothetical protein
MITTTTITMAAEDIARVQTRIAHVVKHQEAGK